MGPLPNDGCAPEWDGWESRGRRAPANHPVTKPNMGARAGPRPRVDPPGVGDQEVCLLATQPRCLPCPEGSGRQGTGQ